ncbi:MAG: RidA family protein [Planctomycetes bacterium]|jgi:enamine deaminase RidA (YjgF/YER057c/UK114 family)|nr:RidA family protein [Planctomycetota bacterium]MCL4729869.1 RidA family protein [Planctomycetota bacterium]
MTRTVVSSGAPWETLYGYRRAVRVGNHVFVAGTAPVADDGATFAPGDAAAQARRCFSIALRALAELGGGPQHVTRTRMYVTDISRADEFGRVHGDLFGAHPPASTMVEVRALVRPDMLIEVELDALIP